MARNRMSTAYPNLFFQRSMWYQTPSVQPTDPRDSMTGSRLSVSSFNARPSVPITVSLLESQPFALTTATESPFLLAAAQGKLPKPVLSKWLSQARLVIQAQISLLGALISRVDLPYALITDEAKATTSIRWRIVNALSHGLQLVHQDLEFFNDVAKRHDLDLEFPPRPDVYFTADVPAKQCIDLFRVFWTDPTMTLLEGMIVFWATLHCRLAAWKYVAMKSDLSQRPGDSLDGGVVFREFVPHWTGMDFEKFVAEIAEVTNLLAEREDGWKKLSVFKMVWQHILDIERRIWPEM